MCIGAIGTIGTVYPGTLFIGDNAAFLSIAMKIGVKFEHCVIEYMVRRL